jgi:small conductance mechanosensitive channel
MQELLDRADTVLPVLPTVIVLVLAVVAWRLSQRLITRESAAASRSEFRLQIAHLIIALVTILLLLLVLPVPHVLRGQLLTLFGIVLSAAITLASTTFVGNVMAGVMLKAVRNFHSGDFVRVGQHFGRVTQRSLLSTEIQTEDRDLVTLPNLYLVTNPVKVVRASGTIISAEVSLGYDAHHGAIEPCLLAAAEDAGLKDPYVLVMELGDFSVVYRANGLLEEVKQLVTVRSRLRVAMLDRLHAAGIEIVSPNFMNTRMLEAERPILPEAPVIAEPSAKEEVAVEDIVFDKAEEAASLEQLVFEHKQTRETIAKLTDEPGDLDETAVKQRQERLARKLAQLEKMIAAKEEEVAREDEAEN